MSTDVTFPLPWCETCHGADARPRNWQMPGVRALPEPELRLAGLERSRLSLDPQMRNAGCYRCHLVE